MVLAERMDANLNQPRVGYTVTQNRLKESMLEKGRGKSKSPLLTGMRSLLEKY